MRWIQSVLKLSDSRVETFMFEGIIVATILVIIAAVRWLSAV